VTSQDDRVDAFRRLHTAGCFVMPNPWDAGTALALEQMGFKAVATTSAGHAWSLGRADNQVLLDQALEHLGVVARAVKLPVNADFEGGFARDPEQVATNVSLAAATGIAGLSIEDSTGDAAEPLYPFELAVERIRAARRAIDESGTGIVLTGRSEGFVVGQPDIEETIRRLKAYAEAGADCLYAPRIATIDHVSAIVAAVSPKPVNLLVNAPFITLPTAASLGFGESASEVRSLAPPGRDSFGPHRRSQTRGPSRASRVCPMSTLVSSSSGVSSRSLGEAHQQCVNVRAWASTPRPIAAPSHRPRFRGTAAIRDAHQDPICVRSQAVCSGHVLCVV
jgi:2-methylisocitrate lyase-like PEP mutase family enzyme